MVPFYQTTLSHLPVHDSKHTARHISPQTCLTDLRTELYFIQNFLVRPITSSTYAHSNFTHHSTKQINREANIRRGGEAGKRKCIWVYNRFKGHWNLYQILVALTAKKKHLFFKTTACILEFYNYQRSRKHNGNFTGGRDLCCKLWSTYSMYKNFSFIFLT